MQQTFISHSRKDEPTAVLVYDGLVARGVNCWISCNDVRPGRNYQDEIAGALDDCSAVILIWSANANSSPEIQKEIGLAAQNNILVIPLKIDNSMPTRGFKYNLVTTQWTELFPGFENTLDKISRDIKQIASRNNEFICSVRELFFANGGSVKPNERAFLLEEGIENGLTEKEAEKIIDRIIGSANNQESEEEYLILIDEVLEDRVVSAIEKKQLEKKAKNLGISDLRAQVLLQAAKEKLGIFDTAITESVREDTQHIIEATKPTSDDLYLTQKDDHEATNRLSAEQLEPSLISTAESDDKADSIRYQRRLDFWTQLLAALKDSKTNLYNKRRPVKRYNLHAYSDINGVEFVIFYKKTQVSICLYISRGEKQENKFTFDALYKKKLAIEQLFGHPLVWERKDQIIASTVSYNQDFDCLNRNDWPIIIQWLVDTLIKFENAFKAPLTELNESIELVLSDSDSTTIVAIRNKINQLISNENTIRPFKSSGQYLRFQPNYFYDHLQRLIRSGLLPADTNLPKDCLFLFEFNLTNEKVTFDFKIGEGEQDIRVRLYNLYKTHSDIFTKVIKPSGLLADSWHQSFQKQILSKNERQRYIDNKSEIEQLIETRIQELFEKDLPKIIACIDNEAKVLAGELADCSENNPMLSELSLNVTVTDQNTSIDDLSEESEDDLEDLTLANTPVDKTRAPPIKNLLTISGKMHVSTLKRQFITLFGLTLRVYDGRSFADEKATIANIRKVDNKGGEFSPGNNTKLTTIENKMMEVFGLKVQIFNSDDIYSCNRELTLKQAKIEDEKRNERKELKNNRAKDTND
jgi:hypothetical protein